MFNIINILSSIGFVASIGGDLLIMFKNKFGYVSWIVGNVVLGYNFLILQRNIPMVLLQGVYVVMNTIGFIKWAKEDKEGKK